MSRTRARQVARLEKLALPYIERKRREQEARASEREKHFAVVANLAVLILYGHPQVGEPLTFAWRRCVESKAWQACRAKHPPVNAHGKESPFDDQGAESIAQYFRDYILPTLPGADETAKLNAVLAKAPPWLLWFTRAELLILSLGLKLPDLSSMSGFDRPKVLGYHHLPDGAFEPCRLPKGVEDKMLWLLLGLMRREPAVLATLPPRMRIANEREEPIDLTPRERLLALRMEERATTSGGAGGSPQAHADDRPELASVAALLRAMSRTSGLVPGATLPPDKASLGATCVPPHPLR